MPLFCSTWVETVYEYLVSMFLPYRLSSEPDELLLGRISPCPQRGLLLNDFFPLVCWAKRQSLTSVPSVLLRTALIPHMVHCVLFSLLLDHEQLSELIHLIWTLWNGAKRLLNGSRQTTCVSFPARSLALGWWLAIVGAVAACPWWHLNSLAELSHQPSSSFIVQGGMAFFASPSALCFVFVFLPPRFCQVLVQNVARFPLVLPGHHITPE